MIRRSDGPKTYWGYYQDYLVEIYEKKSKKNSPRFSAKNQNFLRRHLLEKLDDKIFWRFFFSTVGGGIEKKHHHPH